MILSLFVTLLFQMAEAKVIEERVLTKGYHTKKTVSLRLHDINGREAYSIKRTGQDGTIEAIRISRQSYGDLKKKFDAITQTEKKARIPASESYCHSKILIGMTQATKNLEISTRCFDHFSKHKKSAVLDFLRKANQSFY